MTARPSTSGATRLNPEALLHRALPTLRQRYEARDTIVYALGVGAAQGADAWDEQHLRFVYEDRLQALPTMCAMLCDPGFWMREPDTGLDWQRLVHGEQSMQWLRPLPPAGEVIGRNRVLRVEDRGPDRGAAFVVERELCDADTGACWVRSWMTVIARGDGGFSPASGPLLRLGADALAPLPPLPDRPADRALIRATATHQPLLYRLSADLNPLHADPAVARQAGFERPIMHGMCTFGLLGMLLVSEFCDFEAHRLTEMRARFSAPLYPGETLRCEFWQEAGTVQFRGTAIERDVVVLDRGVARILPHESNPGDIHHDRA
ncbi:MaoC/PaaZ C-terminal domain-containing protein [Hydrogenophaga sp. 2FB]|uniref:MaoC/PaaZ C-terminal domain-containing protein n=1 Tax=Hydrogenophaga sp. 2FB TaxID=2502187 RepID=UPI00207BB956|nr:MaoC/PaaZ C-terminal domain-containing protein [Hydrogenophaga sp. 2FB]